MTKRWTCPIKGVGQHSLTAHVARGPLESFQRTRKIDSNTTNLWTLDLPLCSSSLARGLLVLESIGPRLSPSHFVYSFYLKSVPSNTPVISSSRLDAIISAYIHLFSPHALLTFTVAFEKLRRRTEAAH